MKVCVVHVVVSVTCFMELELYLLTSSLPGIGQTFQSRQTRDLRPTDKQKGTSVFCTYGRLAPTARRGRPQSGKDLAWHGHRMIVDVDGSEGREGKGVARHARAAAQACFHTCGLHGGWSSCMLPIPRYVRNCHDSFGPAVRQVDSSMETFGRRVPAWVLV